MKLGFSVRYIPIYFKIFLKKICLFRFWQGLFNDPYPLFHYILRAFFWKNNEIILLWAVWSTMWKNSQSSSAGTVKANVHLTARTQ